jgi:hypothetical protein
MDKMPARKNTPDVADTPRRKGARNIWEGNEEAKEAAESLIKESFGSASIVRKLEAGFGLKISRYQIEKLKKGLESARQTQLAAEHTISAGRLPKTSDEISPEVDDSDPGRAPGSIDPYNQPPSVLSLCQQVIGSEPLLPDRIETEGSENHQNRPLGG